MTVFRFFLDIRQEISNRSSPYSRLLSAELAKQEQSGLKLMNHGISNVGVTPHFSTGQNLLKKILRHDTHWQRVLTQPIEKSFLIDLLISNIAIHRNSLTLSLNFDQSIMK